MNLQIELNNNNWTKHMAEKNNTYINVSLDDLKKNIDNPETFKKYFEENSIQDDNATPFNLPFDGEKNVCIFRWINTDFNEWFASTGVWDGHKFDPNTHDDIDWVKFVIEALEGLDDEADDVDIGEETWDRPFKK
ncbi:hypothetical protein N9D82_02280 [Gammaproteobacteria bacterium]|nr:hypothetical protein [Gammaproteobacteria bacterium]